MPYYQCQRCTACCRWPGQVRLTDPEITAMAALLGLTDHDFIQRYTRLRHDRKALALQEKQNGECVFLQDGGCLVQNAKPQQCKDFPNNWNFPGWRDICLAIEIPA